VLSPIAIGEVEYARDADGQGHQILWLIRLSVNADSAQFLRVLGPRAFGRKRCIEATVLRVSIPTSAREQDESDVKRVRVAGDVSPNESLKIHESSGSDEGRG
jgi:hypothetical protein